MSEVIAVENIKCGGCMNTIRRSLLRLSGVSGVEIDQERDEVKVEGEFKRDEVIYLLRKLGYPEKGHNDLLHKAKSYVSCALGKVE
ncbi:MAG: heavy metal-associated domain-containing protein [Chloroherpetonaceae bacterium]|nr:heavy metal-associated domain-containing protein [Chloroherpetonaceae bacterium]